MYYNQNDYGHVPYPAPGYEQATVKSGGCGVCCAAMVVEGLTGGSFPPEQAVAFAIACGARVSGGTDFRVLGKAVTRRFGLTMRTENRIAALTRHLRQGGWAVVNVGGDRAGHIGVFSNAGHYIVARGLDSGGNIILWDPGNYSGKYRRAGREEVTVRQNDLLAAPALVDSDAANRSPRYYLFAKEEKEAGQDGESPSAWAAEAWQMVTQAGILDGTGPQQPLTREQLAVVLQRLGLLKK